MAVQIRELTLDDFAIWDEMRHLALATESINFGSSNEDEAHKRSELYERNMGKKDWFILGAFENDKLIGMVGFFRYEQVKTQHKGMIWGMFVHPDFQGKGIGADLMYDAIQRAVNMNGLDIILIGYTEGNAATQKLYEKVGFKVYGREVDCLKHEGQYFNEVLMQMRAEDYIGRA